jgi:ribosomal protein S7
LEDKVPYNLGKEVGGDTPENDKWMEQCVQKVMKTGKDKSSAVAICKNTLTKTKGNKAKSEFILSQIYFI